MKRKAIFLATVLTVNIFVQAQTTENAETQAITIPILEQFVTAMPATASVTQTGSANYSIPIEVPPGTNGLQPQIAISYNSQGGFGAMGIGWDISGLSAITRGSKSFYYDGDAIAYNSVQFDNTDQLYLDGQRLILLSGTHLFFGAVYGFEIENYSRVTAKADGLLIYFELKTPDGQIIEYGRQNNSKLTGTGGTLSWRVSRQADVTGNSINYFYSSLGRTLKKITYAGGENSIEFNYSLNNKNPQKKYIKDFLVVNDSLLSSIVTKNAGKNVKQYALTYTTSSTDKRLLSIGEYNWGTSIFSLSDSFNFLSTTNVEWGEESGILDVIVKQMEDGNVVNVKNSYLYSGDIDGNGTDEIILLHCYKTSTGPVLQIDTYALNAQGTALTLRQSYYADGTLIAVKDCDYNAFLINLNDDQYADLLISGYLKQGSNTTYSTIQLQGLFGNSEGKFGSLQSLLPYVNDEHGVWGNQLLGDFDANGKLDLLHIVAPDQANSHIVFTDHINIIESVKWDNSKRTFFYSEGLINRRYKPFFQALYPVDMNSDNRTDIVIHCNEHTDPEYKWRIALSNGLDAEPTMQETNLVNAHSHTSYKDYDLQYPVFLDYNGDGFTDVVIADETYLSSCNGLCDTKWYFYKNNNGTLELEKIIDRGKQELSRMQPVVMDINNDGIQDLVYADGVNYRAFTMPQANKRLLIHKITNGLGQVDQFTYKYNNSYEKPNGTDVRILNASIVLVDRHIQSNGDTVAYTFQKAKYHKFKGFLGFETTAANNITTDFRTENTYQAIGNYFNWALQTQKVSVPNLVSGAVTQGTSASPDSSPISPIDPPSMSLWYDISTTTYTNSSIVIDAAKKRYIPIILQAVSIDNLTGITKTVNYLYNTNGTLSKEQISEGGFTTKTEYSDFVSANNSPVAYLPQTKKVTYSNSEGNIEYITKFEYNSTGQIFRQTEFFGKPNKIITGFEYFPTGNLKKTTVAITNLTTRTTEYEYDNLFRLPTKKINAFGQYSETGYDFANGNVVSEKGINGLIVSYGYSPSGQLVQKRMPNGQIFSYGRAFTSNYNSKYKTTETMNEPALQTATYYDILGREVYKTQTGANGALLHSSNVYNAQNQLIKRNLPHETTETNPAYTEYTYGLYGRLTQKKTFDGVFENRTGYSYSGKTTTVKDLIDNQVISTTVLNDAGLVASKTDRGGTIVYQYFADKQPKIVTANGSPTEFTYDEYGYQASITDPDAGTITYRHYANGFLSSQANAKGDVSEFLYDALDRTEVEIITEADGGKVYAYIYVYKQSGNGIGQVDYLIYGENNQQKHKRTFSYDANHLITQVTDNYEYTDYTTCYLYDRWWRQTLKQSPSGFQTVNVYDNYGNISEIKMSEGLVIWKLDSQFTSNI
ncbi:MAG: FG-GAP-like repeat-containing protein [Prevotellaceae bacterium]|jgi:YD repeat-containing protein|nr:FG-GAP-like repeat-containing protein [Prevotellaceae bacterium]